MRNGSGSLTGGAGWETIDTTILVYAFDSTNSAKQERANALLQELLLERRLVLSTQVLNEFYNAATRTHRPPALSHDDAVRALRRLEALCEVFPLTPTITFRALEAVPRYRFHFWDALLWASARENGVGIIYTEDLPSAPIIEGVRYINPFEAEAA